MGIERGLPRRKSPRKDALGLDNRPDAKNTRQTSPQPEQNGVYAGFGTILSLAMPGERAILGSEDPKGSVPIIGTSRAAPIIGYNNRQFAPCAW
ncbi:MAG TPA: hypothetical protein VES39_10685 [Rhodospirillales bacterium]|nr:hypothetical protein [Rhodospirillales bacterium]